MDQDGNGRVSLEEFTTSYFEQQKEVDMRIKELNKIIAEDEEKREKLKEKLREIEPTERFRPEGISY
jgi:uncharacterized coiled-coil protein SlyX